MARYSLGLDFGTESVRALLVDLESGREAAEVEFRYPNGVISDSLPVEGGARLERDWFLQHPGDYLTGLEAVVPACLEKAGARGADVAGIGIDFTSCTLMPCDEHGEPLCLKDEFARDPQAWVKLWKHHGAAAEADRILAVARERGEKFLDYYARTISSEWLMPKALETLRRSPEVYAAAHTFVEGADWLVWKLTGRLARNACCAGYKGQHTAELGWPSAEFLAAVEPGLAGLFTEKVPGPVVAPGTKVGGLTSGWADRLGLPEGTPVAAALIDAHAGLVGCGVTRPTRWCSSSAPPPATCRWATGWNSSRASAAPSGTASCRASMATSPGRPRVATSTPGSSTAACRPPTPLRPSARASACTSC